MEDHEKNQLISSKRTKNIAEVLVEVDVLIDTHFVSEFSETKFSVFF